MGVRQGMPQPSIPPHPLPEPSQRADLRVRFESADALRREYLESIAKGALFIPSEDPYAVQEMVEVALDLVFTGAATRVCGEVAVVIDPALAEAGGTPAGISVQIADDPADLRRRLEELSGVSLAGRARRGGADRRAAERSGADADLRIETRDASFKGVTGNISYSGVLALLWRSSIPVGTEVRVVLSKPVVELELCVDGKIVHCARCDEGFVAHGIQLHYPADRIDQVMSFIDFLRAFDRARRLATTSGEIDESGLGSILEMFVTTAPSGTVVVSRGDEEGKIVFSENEILYCTLGIVSGLKALSRMFRWKEGRFEFHHDLQLPRDGASPQPLEAAMMTASVQLDEMARLEGRSFGAGDTFELASELMADLQESLTDLEGEVLGCAADGFNVEGICDVVEGGDAEVYRALSTLLDAGLIKLRR